MSKRENETTTSVRLPKRVVSQARIMAAELSAEGACVSMADVIVEGFEDKWTEFTQNNEGLARYGKTPDEANAGTGEAEESQPVENRHGAKTNTGRSVRRPGAIAGDSRQADGGSGR